MLQPAAVMLSLLRLLLLAQVKGVKGVMLSTRAPHLPLSRPAGLRSFSVAPPPLESSATSPSLPGSGWLTTCRIIQTGCQGDTLRQLESDLTPYLVACIVAHPCQKVQHRSVVASCSITWIARRLQD